jgi:hypothetical protein
MGLDISGIGDLATAAQKIIGMFFPDKTVEEQGKLSAALAMLNAQTDIDKTEAASSDPLQHWRGGLGWVCVVAYLYNFVLEPMLEAGAVMIAGHPLPFPILSIEPLATLTLGMLGLGGLHVAERIKGAA